MSWNVYLEEVHVRTACDMCGQPLPEPKQYTTEIDYWNYTHNTSRMVYAALGKSGITLRGDESWWQHLDGMSGEQGRRYLASIINQLLMEPEFFRKMEPANAWGSYDGLLRVLVRMRDVQQQYQQEGITTEWRANG
jgi:hypothetical protein